MKHFKSLVFVVCLCLMLGTLAGCGGSKNGKEEASPITVTDMKGREVTLEAPATKVVALTASDCEILFAIGAGDTLVGRGEYCDYPAEVLDITMVQSGGETNVEQIIALEPQLVLMNAMDQTEEQVNQLENAGIKVAVSDAADIEGTYQSILMIGTLMGKDEEAAAVVQGMKDTFAKIKESAADLNGMTIYFEVSSLEWGLWAAGSGSFMNEIAEMMGLKNIFDDCPAWAQVSEEQVIERNPDIIVTITMYYGSGPTPEEEIASRPGWEDISAVKNGKILNLPNNELSRPAPRLADGAQLLYDFITK